MILAAQWKWRLVIAAACLAVYWRGLDYGFLAGWDDDAFITANAFFDWNWQNILHWWFTPLEGLLTPLTANSLMLDAALWGKDCPAVFRGINIVLHIITAVLFFSVGRKMRIPAGWMCGIVLCWALHVQRVESVQWIAERKDVLSGALALAAWRFLFLEDRRKGFGAAALCGVLAVFAKPAMAGLAVLFAAVAWVRREKPVSWRYWILPGMAAGAIVLATIPAWITAPDNGVPQDVLLRRIFVVSRNFCWYFCNGAFPLEACPLYPRVTSPAGYFMGAFTLFLLLLTWGRKVYGRGYRWLGKYFPWMLAWGAFFAPSCGWLIFNNTDYADRYNYLPNLIFFLAVAQLGRDTMAKYRRTFLPLTVCSLLLAVFFGVQSFYQIPVWKNPETLFKAALRYSPHPNPKAVEGLGRIGLVDLRPDLLILAGENFLRMNMAARPGTGALRPQESPEIWRNMGIFYMGLAAYLTKQYEPARNWWANIAETDELQVYFSDLYLPVLYGGYADVCLRAGKNAEARTAFGRQMKHVKKEGPVWYRAQGLSRLLAGDEAGALQSLEKSLAGMTVPDARLQQLTAALRAKLSKSLKGRNAGNR